MSFVVWRVMSSKPTSIVLMHADHANGKTSLVCVCVCVEQVKIIHPMSRDCYTLNIAYATAKIGLGNSFSSRSSKCTRSTQKSIISSEQMLSMHYWMIFRQLLLHTHTHTARVCCVCGLGHALGWVQPPPTCPVSTTSTYMCVWVRVCVREPTVVNISYNSRTAMRLRRQLCAAHIARVCALSSTSSTTTTTAHVQQIHERRSRTV